MNIICQWIEYAPSDWDQVCVRILNEFAEGADAFAIELLQRITAHTQYLKKKRKESTITKLSFPAPIVRTTLANP